MSGQAQSTAGEHFLRSPRFRSGAAPAGSSPEDRRGGLLVTVGGRAWNPLMTRDQVLQCLAGARAELAGLGVRSLDLFGSVARGESGPDSDVDLLVDFDRPVGYFHLFEVQDRLEAFLGCKVDLVTQGGLRPELRQHILAEAVRAA